MKELTHKIDILSVILDLFWLGHQKSQKSAILGAIRATITNGWPLRKDGHYEWTRETVSITKGLLLFAKLRVRLRVRGSV